MVWGGRRETGVLTRFRRMVRRIIFPCGSATINEDRLSEYSDLRGTRQFCVRRSLNPSVVSPIHEGQSPHRNCYKGEHEPSANRVPNCRYVGHRLSVDLNVEYTGLRRNELPLLVQQYQSRKCHYHCGAKEK